MLRQRRTGRRSKRRLGTKRYRSHATALNIRLIPLGDTRRASRALAAVLLALLIWVVYSIFNSDSFYVYSAKVEGNVSVTPEQVFGASQLEGLNIFWVDPEQAARSVLERLPNIRSAQVTAQLPARVVISVEERVPYLVWHTGDKEWWVDEEGVAYAPGSGQSQGLVVTDNDARPLRAGQRLDPQVIPAIRALRRGPSTQRIPASVFTRPKAGLSTWAMAPIWKPSCALSRPCTTSSRRKTARPMRLMRALWGDRRTSKCAECISHTIYCVT